MNLGMRKDGEEPEVEINSLFASFYGHSIFTILYTDLKILKSIFEKLEEKEFTKDSNEDGDESYED